MFRGIRRSLSFRRQQTSSWIGKQKRPQEPLSSCSRSSSSSSSCGDDACQESREDHHHHHHEEEESSIIEITGCDELIIVPRPRMTSMPIHAQTKTVDVIRGVMIVPDRCVNHNYPQIKITLEDTSRIDIPPITIASCWLQPPATIVAGEAIVFEVEYNTLDTVERHEWYTLSIKIEDMEGHLLCFNHRVTRAIDSKTGKPLHGIKVPLTYACIDVEEEDEDDLENEDPMFYRPATKIQMAPPPPPPTNMNVPRSVRLVKNE